MPSSYFVVAGRNIFNFSLTDVVQKTSRLLKLNYSGSQRVCHRSLGTVCSESNLCSLYQTISGKLF